MKWVLTEDYSGDVRKMNVQESSSATLNLMENVEGDLNFVSEVGVILPTYREALNIKKLIEEIESLNLNISILVIDDSSPDGTANIVRSLHEKYENILLYVRPQKLGLGTAITDGFRIFLSLRNAPRCIITMDADYSHDPKYIPLLVSTFRVGYDLVVGSRYCRGGGVANWSILRRLISKIANLIASALVKAGIQDYTSGFRCYSIELVRSIIGELHSQTYEIQIETISQTSVKNFRIKEVPITFVNRDKGKSKLTLNEIKQFVSYVLTKIIA
ncbi:MAG: polyprenol monophosphomannose synthase [Candidatus Bathycorpusculaceae bacterium]